MLTRRRSPAIAESPLTDDEVAVLLAGWAARPDGVGDGPADVRLDIWQDAAAAWRAHAAFLRERARAWAWRPSYYIVPANVHGLRRVVREPGGPGRAGPFYFAEACDRAGQRVG